MCACAHAYAQHLMHDYVTAGGGQVFQPSLRDKHRRCSDWKSLFDDRGSIGTREKTSRLINIPLICGEEKENGGEGRKLEKRRGGVASSYPSSIGTRGKGLRGSHVIHLLQLSSVRWKCSKMNLLWVLKPNKAPHPSPTASPPPFLLHTHQLLHTFIRLSTVNSQQL